MNKKSPLDGGSAATTRLTRRTLLGAAAGAPLLMKTVSATDLHSSSNDHQGPSFKHSRKRQAYKMRTEAALRQYQRPSMPIKRNQDEERFSTRIGNFCKGLPHDSQGKVDRHAYDALLRALQSGDESDFESIPMGGTAKLVSPLASWTLQFEGVDSHAARIAACPSILSQEHAAEAVELYWSALTRDIPFARYDGDATIAQAAKDLQRFERFQSISTVDVFRGEAPGDRIGPYVSQFLWQPVPFGAMTLTQRYRTTAAGDDHLVAYQDWLNVQNGQPPSTQNAFDAHPRYLRNGRDLGEYVQRDFTCQAFLNAGLILLGWGPNALDPSHPYRRYGKQAGFASHGASDMLAIVAKVADYAIKAAWFQKWLVHRRVRPEEYGGLIHSHLTNTKRHPLHASLLDSPALHESFSRYGSYLLPQAYPGGCPLHPAYPSGHAAIAGACVTVLKALFDEDFLVPNAVEATEDGLSLSPYVSEALRLGHELNKLASNIAIARDTAGVHWRSDASEGMRLGERVALALLDDLKHCYREYAQGFALTKFDGKRILV
jgi:hypothetical protein